ncbi:MAG: putative capsid protein [Geminiviridae sp.]|nr:MAG: putative capsid protein [Geminiviridae sp.]
MAYGRTRRKSTRPYRRASTKKAVPVPRVKRTVRKSTRTNALAINRNASMLRQLKMSQYGSIQKNFQNSRGAVNPTNSRPVLLDLSDFSKGDPSQLPPIMGAQWYQKTTAGVLQAVNMWESSSLGLNPYWLNVNKDIPNSGKIFECWQKITFKIEGNLRLTDTRIRFDVFRAKPRAFTPNAANVASLILPGSLNHFGGLAECTNKISSVYYKKILTKWVYLNSSRPDANQGTVQGTTGNSRFVSIYLKMNRVRTQSLTNPVAVPISPEYQEGNWGPLNSALGSCLWCLISASDPLQGDVQDVQVTASRTVCWRDPSGQAAVF